MKRILNFFAKNGNDAEFHYRYYTQQTMIMLKKILFLFVIASFFFVNGCGSNAQMPVKNAPANTSVKEEKLPKNYVPFLTFSVNKKAWHTEAYLNYWDIANGKIIMTNKVMYTVSAQPHRTENPKIFDWSLPVHMYGPPLSWDGESYIYLSNYFHKPENIPPYLKLKMFEDPINPAKYVGGKEIDYPYIYAHSKDLEVREKNVNPAYLYSKAKYGEFTFSVFDDNGNTLLKKDIKISFHNDTFHGGVDIGHATLYEKDKKTVKMVRIYYDTKGKGHFPICTIDLNKGTYHWNEVKGIGGCIPLMGRNNISIINNKFYVPFCGSRIGVIDPDNYTCKFIDTKDIFKSLSFYNATVYWSEDTPLDEYKNFLILRATVPRKSDNPSSSADGYEYLWILFDTKTNKVVQLLEWSSLNPQFIVVRSPSGKELSEVKTDELVKNIGELYDVSGNSYINGLFIRENFIRFPHKNGS